MILLPHCEYSIHGRKFFTTQSQETRQAVQKVCLSLGLGEGFVSETRACLALRSSTLLESVHTMHHSHVNDEALAMSTPMSTKYPMSTLYPMKTPNNALLLQYLSICSPQATLINSGRGNLHHTDALFVGKTDSKVPAGATARHRGNVSAKELRDNFHLPLHTVAKKFGMCTTAFKKLCRRFEIPKWPHRQVIIRIG